MPLYETLLLAIIFDDRDEEGFCYLTDAPDDEWIPPPDIESLVVREMWLVRQQLFNTWDGQTARVDDLKYGLN